MRSLLIGRGFVLTVLVILGHQLISIYCSEMEEPEEVILPICDKKSVIEDNGPNLLLVRPRHP